MVAARAGGRVVKTFAALIVVASACGSSSHGPNLPDAYQGSGATCSALTSGIADFEPDVDGTPSGFPSAPTGLVLCGTDPMSDNPGAPVENWYLAGTLSGSDVFDYYTPMLMTDGYTVSAPVTESGGNIKLVFMNTSSGSDGAVVYNSTELFVLVTFPIPS
jgi:hypothetical protein